MPRVDPLVQTGTVSSGGWEQGCAGQQGELVAGGCSRHYPRLWAGVRGWSDSQYENSRKRIRAIPQWMW